ncbi:MAG TPA: hypothetical protein P5275_04305 [Saprospiraceae bacterium]|nr:hypothetical protein [Saprospiraceae bacterium]MCB9269615.1 hypothetical protein [Lewinellaceae bacterium]HPG06073.1 hypothetical protein [Saprospiraceae bacterium]HPR01040.1 hypothetical protein [Saprospiraceae bacterium]HQU55231.1 hypothetical protein [Saprospiraceae bacterium]
MLEQILIGKVLKSTGAQGSVKVQLDQSWDDVGDQLSVVLLDLEGDRVPYFIDSCHYQDTWIWHFDDVQTPEEAKSLSLAPIYALKRDLPKAGKGNQIPRDLNFLSGWVIKNQDGEHIGTIEEVREYPEQWMAILNISGNEKLVPLVDAFILDLDEKKKTIRMELPDGLLDL